MPRSVGVVFGPWLLCEAAREGLPFLSLSLFLFCLLILTIYLGSLAATRSSQGGLRSATLGGGFRSLAARAAARRAVYSISCSAGVVFGPWLLCKAARKGFLFFSLSRGLWSAALRRGFRSLAARVAARRAVYGVLHSAGMVFVPGCFAKQPGKVSCSVPFPPPFFCLFILTIYLGSLAAT